VVNTNRTIGWRDIDFRPAPPGWRAVYLGSEGDVRIEYLAGWLIQEEELYGHSGRKHPREDTRPEDRDRRVTPAFHAAAQFGAELVEVESVEGLWRILPPGEPDPTAEEIRMAAVGLKAVPSR
jgi:hypothetical protein